MSSATVSAKDKYDVFAPEYDRWDTEHRSVEQLGKVALEIRRLLKPGRRFVALCYHRDRDLTLLRRSGWEIFSTREWPSGDRPICQIVAGRAVPPSRPAGSQARSPSVEKAGG